MSSQPEIDTRTVDVLIVGGGMAGVFAAFAAKEPDVRVVLLEPSNVLGGQGTAGGVAGFCGDIRRVNRPFAELIRTLEGYGKIAPYSPTEDRRAYDLEHCAFCLQEQVAEQDIDVLLHARALDAQVVDGTVTVVRASCGSQEIEFRPRMVIDATGECVLAVAAGFETLHEGANRQLPMSLYFTLCH